jgi:hypothetical protein
LKEQMRAITNNPKSGALASFLLAFPFTILFLSLIFGLQPSLGVLDPLLNTEGSHLGTFIMLGTLILHLMGLTISSKSAWLGIKQGDHSYTARINLLLAAAISLILVGFICAIVIDQYPCWTGVPNCD